MENPNLIEILPSLMKLFATVSALILTFLIILYNAVKSKIGYSKQNVIREIGATINCRRAQKGLGLTKGDKLVDELVDECYHDRINEDRIKELLALMETKIKELRNDGISTESNEEAGKRAKLAAHIETDHHNDINDALESYNKSKSFYSIFPLVSFVSVGVPLLLSAFYLSIYLFQYEISNIVSALTWRWIVLATGVLGIGFIFGVVVFTIQKLRSIDY